MTMAAKGYAKLLEEMGELTQVIGKRLAMWNRDDHWDGTDLTYRTMEEIADLSAALTFVVEKNFSEEQQDMISLRAEKKYDLFMQWDKELDNNTNGIDS